MQQVRLVGEACFSVRGLHLDSCHPMEEAATVDQSDTSASSVALSSSALLTATATDPTPPNPSSLFSASNTNSSDLCSVRTDTKHFSPLTCLHLGAPACADDRIDWSGAALRTLTSTLHAAPLLQYLSF